MTDAAFELAALRAERVRQIDPSALDSVAEVAERLGRSVVEVRVASGSVAHTLSWADGYEPAPHEETFVVRRLAPVAQLALGTCIGLCWRDREGAPYPGEPVAFNEAVSATVALGVDYKHVVGALRGDLQFAGLLLEDGQSLRLGPAFAAWPPAQLELLRRAVDTLPGVSDG